MQIDQPRVSYYTDNTVVGAFLSPAAVTLYAIGGLLIGYVRQIKRAVKHVSDEVTL